MSDPAFLALAISFLPKSDAQDRVIQSGIAFLLSRRSLFHGSLVPHLANRKQLTSALCAIGRSLHYFGPLRWENDQDVFLTLLITNKCQTLQFSTTLDLTEVRQVVIKNTPTSFNKIGMKCVKPLEELLLDSASTTSTSPSSTSSSPTVEQNDDNNHKKQQPLLPSSYFPRMLKHLFIKFPLTIALAKAIAVGCTSLETLYVPFYHVETEAVFEHLAGCCGDNNRGGGGGGVCKSLRTLDLSEVNRQCSGKGDETDYYKTTTLRTNNPNISEMDCVFDFISKCPNLESFVFPGKHRQFRPDKEMSRFADAVCDKPLFTTFTLTAKDFHFKAIEETKFGTAVVPKLTELSLIANESLHPMFGFGANPSSTAKLIDNDNNPFSWILENATSLRSLTISRCSDLQDGRKDLQRIVDNMPLLEVLKLNKCDKMFPRSDGSSRGEQADEVTMISLFEILSVLQNLRVLEMKDNTLPDITLEDFFFLFANNNKSSSSREQKQGEESGSYSYSFPFPFLEVLDVETTGGCWSILPAHPTFGEVESRIKSLVTTPTSTSTASSPSSYRLRVLRFPMIIQMQYMIHFIAPWSNFLETLSVHATRNFHQQRKELNQEDQALLIQKLFEKNKLHSLRSFSHMGTLLERQEIEKIAFGRV